MEHEIAQLGDFLFPALASEVGHKREPVGIKTVVVHRARWEILIIRNGEMFLSSHSADTHAEAIEEIENMTMRLLNNWKL